MKTFFKTFYLCLALLSAEAGAQSLPNGTGAVGGHLKGRADVATYPDDSRFRDVFGARSRDLGLELRLKTAFRQGRWGFAADYQGIALNAETLRPSILVPGLPLVGTQAIDDRRRWWDLTPTIGELDGTLVIHRLDRLNVSWTGARTVLRFGRQAISWGNGLLFNPLDVFNPFDPAAVDTEYKTGDDMLYGQYLFDNGHDLQGVAVVRRDPLSGEVESVHSSLAF